MVVQEHPINKEFKVLVATIIIQTTQSKISINHRMVQQSELVLQKHTRAQNLNNHHHH
jgi:hypothetical protein